MPHSQGLSSNPYLESNQFISHIDTYFCKIYSHIILHQLWNKPRNFIYILPKGPKLNPTKQYEIYKHYKQSPTNILNDQLYYKSHALFDTIIHASHINICAIPTTMNQKMNFVANSTGTAKHWKWCTWHRKASA